MLTVERCDKERYDALSGINFSSEFDPLIRSFCYPTFWVRQQHQRNWRLQLVADGDDEAVVGGDKGGAGGTAGGEGVLVEGPAVEDAGEGRGVGRGGGQGRAEGGGGHGRERRRGERQAGHEGGEDGAGGGASIDGGGQRPAQARGEVALGEQVGTAAGADRAGPGTLLGGGEHGASGVEGGQRGHTSSCVVRPLYAERTRPGARPCGQGGAATGHEGAAPQCYFNLHVRKVEPAML